VSEDYIDWDKPIETENGIKATCVGVDLYGNKVVMLEDTVLGVVYETYRKNGKCYGLGRRLINKAPKVTQHEHYVWYDKNSCFILYTIDEGTFNKVRSPDPDGRCVAAKITWEEVE